ncbi:hypothetical protein [Streptomyces sp. NPDC088261]|uniref:hypothetical protein n=1 Tax=Streptomyces sp. NPDC088261 TaxID=3365851 RepID=UPI003827887A
MSLKLPSFMTTARQAVKQMNSTDRMLAPIRREIRQIEATRRAVESVVGPDSGYQAAVDIQHQVEAITEPVLALRRQLSDPYDWHSRIDDIVRSVSLPRSLLDQLAAAAVLFLPKNLGDLTTDDLYAVLDLCKADGLSVAWAPQASIVRALLSSSRPQEQNALLDEYRLDVLDDMEASLEIIGHPDLAGMRVIFTAALRAARAGLNEGAQALASNVLETAMKQNDNAWIRRSFPQVAYPAAGRHGTTASALTHAYEWSDLTLSQFKPSSYW